MLRFGIMGCGKISDRFCRVLAGEGGVAIQAVAARDGDRAAAFAEKHGARRSCSYEELVRDSEVDIVYIGTVHSHHYEQIKLCLENGKHVLSEKPMVLHGDEARECFALAREKKLLLMENMWPRSNPCVRTATEWVRGGRIGEVKLADASFCFRAPYNPASRLFDPATAGGAVYDVGVYGIEFVTGILGENPESVVSAMKPVGGLPDGSAAMLLSFGSGAIATVRCAITVATPHEARVYGAEGWIRIPEFWKAHDAFLYGPDGKEIDRVHADFEDGFRFQIRHVVELFERGATESDLIPPADTIACADLFDKILG